MSVPCEPDCNCDGRCCAVFFFPSTPREIKQRIEDNGDYNGLDGMMIANMLIRLTPAEARERAERFGISAPESTEMQKWTEDTPLYTCKNWDEDTRLCKVYEVRPKMCADYPYGKPCGHGCGFDNSDDPNVKGYKTST